MKKAKDENKKGMISDVYESMGKMIILLRGAMDDFTGKLLIYSRLYSHS